MIARVNGIEARLRALWFVALIYLAGGAALRGTLWLAFGRSDVPGWQLLWIVPAGMLNDAVQSLYLLAPAMLCVLLPDRWWRTRVYQCFRDACLAGTISLLVFIWVAEYFFFEEFAARFNPVAVDYLLYPTEVFGDIRAEYPVRGTLFAALAIGCAVVLWWRTRIGRESVALPTRGIERAAVVGCYALVFAALVAGWRTDLLAESVLRSDNRLARELAANGIASFFRALRTSDIDYHRYYASRPADDNLRTLARHYATWHLQPRRRADGVLVRRVADNPHGLGRLNVVVLVCESFGAEFSRLYGGAHDWTPRFDRLAQQGMWFADTYASGTRTVRGLEAIATSLPPIPTVSILHRPGSEHVANWGAVMRAHGYRTSFLYGGYGEFDDMNEFFASNGFQVLDRRAIRRPTRFANIWGVSDEDLYDLAIEHFDAEAARGKPFFAIVMNTSNHKPFTFRAGIPGVRPEGGGRESGVRYADYALDYFISAARRHDWFDDTLFVIVADHGARVYGRAAIPLDSYRIPLLLYAPRYIAPQRVGGLTTQIDIAPTVLGLLGLGYSAPFFGIDVLRVPRAGRVALFSHNHDVALLQGETLAVLGLHKRLRVASRTAPETLRNARDTDRALTDLAIAYYQSAYEWFRAGRYTIEASGVPALAMRTSRRDVNK
ncbi:MAG: LTA synthase family protein [Steroidobacteraceae bacterium]|nr:LTA synthase family protein [Steroidobacteraceae bacterium]MDW8257879.1 LTA synthase family protein [Gammaproteobacteria bacterium]